LSLALLPFDQLRRLCVSLRYLRCIRLAASRRPPTATPALASPARRSPRRPSTAAFALRLRPPPSPSAFALRLAFRARLRAPPFAPAAFAPAAFAHRSPSTPATPPPPSPSGECPQPLRLIFGPLAAYGAPASCVMNQALASRNGALT
jgi:hypothetical protein